MEETNESNGFYSGGPTPQVKSKLADDSSDVILKQMHEHGKRLDIFSHPMYKSMISYGYGDEEQCTFTFLIYLDLIECREWHNVKLCPVSQLKMILISGYPCKLKELHYILPASVNSSVSMFEIQNIFAKLQEMFQAEKLLIAYVDHDSNIVYYSLTATLVVPDPPHSPGTENPTRDQCIRKRKQDYVLKVTK